MTCRVSSTVLEVDPGGEPFRGVTSMGEAISGHRETQTKLPDPVGGGWWNPGAWALPALTISAASAVVLVVVLWFLQRNATMRSLFVLPWYAGAGIALLALLLASLVVWRGSRRPGRLAPRLWALLLALVSLAALVSVCAFPRSSWPHAMAVASLAAAVTLTTRMVRLRPNSALVQSIAALSVLGVLPAVLLGTAWVGERIVTGKRTRVEGLIAQLRGWETEVEAVTGYSWKDMAVHREAAAQTVARLGALSFADRLGDADLWRESVVLGLDDELSAAARELLDAVVDGLDPARVPRVSSFPDPALHYDPYMHRWERSKEFPEQSAIVGSYHREIGRLFGELEVPDLTAAVAGGPFQQLLAHRQAARERLRLAARTIATSFSDHWAVLLMPQRRELVGMDATTLVDALQLPLLGLDSEEPLAAADVAKLLRVPRREAEWMVEHNPSCRRLPDYDDRGLAHFRIDCYAYEPRAGHGGAELAIEVRLVYQAQYGTKTVPGGSLPVELYFLFPIPAERQPDDFRIAVMSSLGEAVRARSSARVEARDRGNSLASGFRVVEGDDVVQVDYPRVISLVGDERGLQVRALRRD